MSKPVYIDTITSCDGCPFSVLRDARYKAEPFYCNHPKFFDPSNVELLPPTVALEDNPYTSYPNWCPLMEGPALVSLRVKKTEDIRTIYQEGTGMPTETFGHSEKKPIKWTRATINQWAQYMHDGDWLNLSSTFPGPGMLSRVPYEVPGIWLRSCRFEDK